MLLMDKDQLAKKKIEFEMQKKQAKKGKKGDDTLVEEQQDPVKEEMEQNQ